MLTIGIALYMKYLCRQNGFSGATHVAATAPFTMDTHNIIPGGATPGTYNTEMMTSEQNDPPSYAETMLAYSTQQLPHTVHILFSSA